MVDGGSQDALGRAAVGVALGLEPPPASPDRPDTSAVQGTFYFLHTYQICGCALFKGIWESDAAANGV